MSSGAAAAVQLEPVEAAWGPDVAAAVARFGDQPGWLVALDDAARVGASLRRWVPELRTGRLSLARCEVVRIRLRDDTWTARYEVVVEGEEGASTVSLSARLLPPGADEPDPGPPPHGPSFGRPDWTCYLPELRLEATTMPPDDALATLPALTDPERARPLLERGIRGASPDYADLRVEACDPRVMRYKPGRRCTVLFHMTYPESARGRGWPDPVVAKTHIGSKGANAHASMTALWASPLRRSDNVAIAEPLGYLPEENVVLQGPVREERTLKEQLRRSLVRPGRAGVDELRPLLEKTARGLADLHGCGVTEGDAWTFEHELDDVRNRVARLARFEPDVGDAGAAVLGRLEGLAADHPPDPFVPSHRSFRPAQVLIHGNDIGFIDFDGFCQAEPALDLALFLSVLRDLCLRALQKRDGRPAPGEPARPDHMALLDELGDAFMDAYRAAATTPVTAERVYVWQALLVFDRVVTCWTKDRPERLPHCVALLAHLLSRQPAAA